MAWAIAGAVILIVLLLDRILLQVKLHVGLYFVEIGLCFRVLFRLIPFNLRYRIQFEPHEGIRILRYEKHGGFKILKILGEKKKKNTAVDKAVLRAIRSGMTLESVEVTGEIGIPSDAFLCVIASGAIRILLENGIRLGVPLALDKKQPSKLIVNFFPCLTRRSFNLKLEGILSAGTLKLIKNAAIAVIKNHKGEKE